MREVLDQAQQESLCPVVRLAYRASRKSFEFLDEMTETKGLSFEGGPKEDFASIFYERDPTWPHECIPTLVSKEVILQLSNLAGAVLVLAVRENSAGA